MIKFRWKIDFGKVKQNDEPEPNYINLFSTILDAALISVYKDGIGKDLTRRSWNVCNKVETATDEYIDLSDAEWEMIQEAFEKAKFNPVVKKYVVQYYNFIDDTKDVLDKEKKAADLATKITEKKV